MNQDNNGNTQTAENANANAQADAGNNNAKKKSKLRRYSGYALKGAVVGAIGAGLYFGVRALMGSAGEAVIDGAVGAVA